MPVVLFFGMIALNLFQAYAAIDGLHYAFGAGTTTAVIVIIALFAMLRDTGALIVNAFGAVGLVYVWQWAWWQAALACFPELAWFFGIYVMGTAAEFILKRQKAA